MAVCSQLHSFPGLIPTIGMKGNPRKPALDRASSSLSQEEIAKAREVRKNALKGQGECYPPLSQDPILIHLSRSCHYCTHFLCRFNFAH